MMLIAIGYGGFPRTMEALTLQRHQITAHGTCILVTLPPVKFKVNLDGGSLALLLASSQHLETRDLEFIELETTTQSSDPSEMGRELIGATCFWSVVATVARSGAVSVSQPTTTLCSGPRFFLRQTEAPRHIRRTSARPSRRDSRRIVVRGLELSRGARGTRCAIRKGRVAGDIWQRRVTSIPSCALPKHGKSFSNTSMRLLSAAGTPTFTPLRKAFTRTRAPASPQGRANLRSFASADSLFLRKQKERREVTVFDEMVKVEVQDSVDRRSNYHWRLEIAHGARSRSGASTPTAREAVQKSGIQSAKKSVLED